MHTQFSAAVASTMRSGASNSCSVRDWKQAVDEAVDDSEMVKVMEGNMSMRQPAQHLSQECDGESPFAVAAALKSAHC